MSITNTETKFEPVFDEIVEAYCIDAPPQGRTSEMLEWVNEKPDIASGEHGFYTRDRQTAIEFYLRFAK